MSSKLTRLVPKSIRVGAKSLPLVSTALNHRHAQRLARTTRRLDACLDEFVMLAAMVEGFSLNGKTCLEIGSGWVLSHALAAHVVGAKTAIATDIAPVAYPPSLVPAVREAEGRINWEKLAQLGDVSEFRERFDSLSKIDRFTLEALNAIGVEYVAPKDLAAAPIGRPLDFVYSISVLEHVPAADVPSVLANLAADLTDGGAMYHSVDLIDHEDRGDPFAFLAIPEQIYGRDMQSARGNRIRLRGWDSILCGVGGIEWRYLWRETCDDKPLPDPINSSVSCADEADARSARLGIYGVKEPKV